MISNLIIMQMNDSHAYLDLHQELFWSGDHASYYLAGGYARIASVLNEARHEAQGRVLAFDNGDTFHGTYPAIATEGEALIPALNALDFDAMTAHWEFAYGPKQVKRLAGLLDYPLLACNIYHKSSGDLFFDPYLVKEVNGLKIGIIGIASNIVDKTMPTSFSEGLSFTLGRAELPEYIRRLSGEEKTDLIVVLSHLGFPQDCKLAEEVEGIDVLLSGHTHNKLYKPFIINDTIIIQSGKHGSFLGKLYLEIDDRKVSAFEHKLITIKKEIQPDSQVQEIVERVKDRYCSDLCQMVGTAKTALNRDTVLESTMDNFLLMSLLNISGAEIAFSNGWRYGAPVPPGPITLEDLWNIIPMNPHVSVVELKGKEIWAMMEENLEHTFSRDPYNQIGGYVKRCRGLNIYFKIESPSMARINEVFIGGKLIELDRTYKTAFVTSQGVPPRYGTNRKDLDADAISAMIQLLDKGPLESELNGSIIAI